MSWLDRENLIKIQQRSNIPYIILKKGVYLCCDNFFSEEKLSSENHFIEFFENKNKLSRKSTYYYEYKKFPITIPFNRVITLDGIVKNGNIEKKTSYNIGRIKHISIIMQNYVDEMDDSQFNDLIDNISSESFLITETELDIKSRSLVNVLEMATVIYHTNWYRTLISILDNIKDKDSKGYCWTTTLPELEISCYGLTDQLTVENIHEVMNNIGIKEFTISWE